MARYEITVDTRKGPWVGDPVRVRVGDVGSCVIVAHVTEGSAERDLAGLTARFECLKPDGTVVRDSECEVDGSTITHTLARHVAQYPGECAAAYFSILNADGTLVDSTQSFALVVQDGTGTGGVSSDYISDISTLMALLEAQKQKYATAEAAREEAEGARATAEGTREDAEAIRDASEGERVANEEARQSAESARSEAESARADAETARVAAEAQRQSNEAERQGSETSRQEAESSRQGAESTRAEAESARASAESGRATAEPARAGAETARESAEADRAGAESARADAEAMRAADEGARSTAEDARAKAEAARVGAEDSRATAESARADAEAARADAESARATAEGARESAEDARAASQAANDAAQAKNNADQAANNAAASGITFVILGEGEYDADTLEPTGGGENGKFYLVPDPNGTGENRYLEFAWLGGKWEHIGSTSGSFNPIGTDQIDDVAAGSQAVGTAGLNLTGLSYLWGKLRAAFAPLSHVHSKADITDFPESMPASDVSAWAKEPQRPTYAVADVSGLRAALDAKQTRPAYAQVTVAPSDWQGNMATVAVAGVTASSVVRVSAAPESELAASEAHVWCYAQADGRLGFTCVTEPTAPVTLNVEVTEA